ncbi:MAG: hypothetical protein ACK5Q5_20720 [Planctomycetaceae bacterium]
MNQEPTLAGMVRPWLRMLFLSVLLVSPGGLAAQEAAPPSADGAPVAPPAPVLVEQNTSGHYFEFIVTAIGVGVALFAVCRSSQRN